MKKVNIMKKDYCTCKEEDFKGDKNNWFTCANCQKEIEAEQLSNMSINEEE